MQFGSVLAFATLVLASPTPTKPEARDVTAGPVVISFDQNVLNAFSTLVAQIGSVAATDVAAVTSAGSVAQGAASTAVSSIAGAAATAASKVQAVLKPAESAFVKSALSLLPAVKDLIAATASATATLDNKALSAINNLISSVQSANLGGVAHLTISAAITGVQNALSAEIANDITLINSAIAVAKPLVDPLNQIQTTLKIAAAVNAAPTAQDLGNAILQFLTQAAAAAGVGLNN